MKNATLADPCVRRPGTNVANHAASVAASSPARNVLLDLVDIVDHFSKPDELILHLNSS